MKTKLKTHRGAAKRFKLTGSGKLSRRRAGKRHMLSHKSSKRKRKMSGKTLLCGREARAIHLAMPYTH